MLLLRCNDLAGIDSRDLCIWDRSEFLFTYILKEVAFRTLSWIKLDNSVHCCHIYSRRLIAELLCLVKLRQVVVGTINIGWTKLTDSTCGYCYHMKSVHSCCGLSYNSSYYLELQPMLALYKQFYIFHIILTFAFNVLGVNISYC